VGVGLNSAYNKRLQSDAEAGVKYYKEKRVIKIFIGILVFILSLPASAGFLDGNDLVSNMREYERAGRSDPNTDYMVATEFRGYVIGVYDTLELTNSVCSRSAAKRQIGAVVTKYLNDNPARWSEPAAMLVADALKSTFPCNK
jgi:nucleoside diphosphate kinase